MAALTASVTLLLPAAPTAGNPDPALSISAGGANGVGSLVDPGLPCAQGGQGNYRDFLMGSALPPGVVSGLPGNLRVNLDLQHDGVEPPVGPITTKAFLLGNVSHATVSNQRGTLQLALSSGTCAAPTLTLSSDGTTVSGSGTWVIDPASAGNTGSYRGASGTGTFTLTNTRLGPGAANSWNITLTSNGSVSVLSPSMAVSVVNTYWGNLGLDYAARNVSVTYQVTNTGPGDAFGVVLNSTAASNDDVTPLGPTPQTLGDIPAGASATVTVRYHIGLLGACALVVLGCQFGSTLTATMPDALDVPATYSASAAVTAPNFPPPA